MKRLSSEYFHIKKSLKKTSKKLFAFMSFKYFSVSA